MAQQDDYFYEIQLTNKQLVFYFLAGATGLILSFLAGVMVGRGVDNSGAAVEAAKPVQEERVVAEEAVKPSPPAAEELTYAQRLETDKPAESLEKSPRGAEPARPAAQADKPPAPAPSAKAAAKEPAPEHAAGKEKPGPAKSAAPPRATAKPTGPAGKPPAPGTFTIQVGAFKDKEAADSVAARLKKKGFATFVVAPDGTDGLFNVRVGAYAARADAERVQAKLRDEEKFKPFIVKN